MSVAVGTKVAFRQSGDPQYRGLIDGEHGMVVPDSKYVNMFEDKDEFTVSFDAGAGLWFFSRGDEGVTWVRVRVSETVYGEGEGLFE